jgi:medium-chain acyl-[acyl-carrier-protein] hydrolase
VTVAGPEPIRQDGEEINAGGWFVPLERRAAAGLRLYAFPHAGAGPGALGRLAAELDPSIELWALNLPGRQARLAEPPCTDLESLIDALAADLVGTPGPYAFFGYCGGALLAYLLARRTAPERLFVGSFAAPDLALIPRRLHQLPTDRFWDVVLAQGGVPPALAERTEVRPVFEPGLRADFALYSRYRHRPSKTLDVPITVLYGRDDEELSRGELLGWRRQTSSPPDLCEVPAGHWLIDEAPAAVAAALTARLRADADTSAYPAS